MRYEDASGAFQASGPIANDDADTLSAGERGPATGNLITGEGTQYGSAGADSAAGAKIAAIAGKGGEDASFSGGKLSVEGEHGRLSVDAEGNYSYMANGNVENVRDRFTYTLADNAGNTDTAALIVEIGKTPAVIKANAQQVVPGPDGVVTLPPGVELSDVRVVGRNLVVDLPDGTQLIIIDGAIFVPQLVLGGVEVPATNVAALLIGQEVQPAAGEIPPSGGGNFALPPPPLDPGIPLGDLIPPTELNYVPPEPQEVFPEEDDEEPEIFVQPDGQPAAIAAVDQVEEAGLPTRNGNLPGEPAGSGESADGNGADNDVTSETTTGNIVYDSPDGVDSITLNGVVITTVGQVIPGAFGDITITSIAPGVIGYSYTLDDNTSGNDTHDDFQVILTDSDGDQASATLRIDIVDDVPFARPDTDAIAAGQYGPVTGNVITDASAGDAGDSDSGADTVGADNATITAVSSANVPANSDNGAPFVVNGQYGVLTLQSDGSYSYVRNAGTPGGVQDVFNYTLTDGDGDPSSTTLTITIADATPETRPNPLAQLDDDALAGGIPGGVGDDPDAANLSGNLLGVGGDGPLTFDLLLTGAPAGFSYVDGPGGAVHVMQGGTHVLTITINAATGAYTISQVNPIDHPAGGDENNVQFTINYQVRDQDGDTADGTLNIDVDDDTPEMNRADVSLPTLTVDETDLTTNASADYSVVFDGDFGADGPGTLSYAVSVVNGTDSGLVDVATGDPILLFMNGSVVEGRVGGAGGAVAFTVSVNSGTGVVTLDQIRALEHPLNPNNDEPVSAIADSIQLTASITDGDGDSDSLAVNIGHTLVFEDDGPTVSPTLNAQVTVTVDESLPSNDPGINTGGIAKGDDPHLAGGIAIGQSSSGSAIVNANAVFGADGPAAGGGISYALVLGANDTTLTLTDGSTISLQLVGGVVVGVVDNGPFAGQAAFALAIDPNSGVVTVEQYLSLDHPVNPDPNDPLGLGPNSVGVTVTATDGDGDPVTSGAVDISNQITFLDDGPTVSPTLNAQVTVTVDESLPSNDPGINTGGIAKGDDPHLAGGIAIGQSSSGSAIVNANAVFGADGPAAGGGISYALVLGANDTTLTLTDGSTISLQLVGGVVVGVVDNGPFAGQAAFALAIDPTTGVVTVEQYLSLDHPVNPDPNDPLGLGPNSVGVTVTATDGDGDPVTSGAVDISNQITFLDDGPTVSPTLSTAGPAIVDESEPVHVAAIDTGGFTKADDPHLGGGLAIGLGSTGGAVLNANAVFGADGPAAAGSLSYDLVILNASSGLTTTEGNAINLVELPSGVIVGVVSGGSFNGQAAFAISINSTTGVVTVEQYLSLDHPDFPDNFDEAVFLNENVLGATVTATDGDGDPVTSPAVDIGSKIQFEDDGPSATDEPQQNVQEGNQTVSGTFDFVGGADGASVTHLNDIALVFAGDGWSQWIPVDDGQIRAQADGDYQFQSDASGSGVTSGTFTVTDGDGDQVEANWAFNITDANAPTAGISAARLDDDGLAGGNPLSTTNDIDANVGERPGEANPEEDIFNGQLTLNFGGDGPGTVTFAAMHNLTGSVGTETVRYTWAGSTLTATVEGGARNGTVLFDIVVDQATGEYTLTLRDNVIHTAGGDETSAPNVALTYTVTDSDNSPAGGVNGTLNITFNDDAPTVTNVQAGAGVDVDETDAGTPAGFPISDTSAGAVITATSAFGADGAAAANATVYGLAITGGPASGLFTAVGNFAITLVQIDGDTIQGHYNGSNVAFTIQMNANGTVTLTQNVPLEHNVDGAPGAPHNDTLDLTGLINATITITDGDGDTATGSAPIGDNLVFFDDGPDAQVDGQAVLDQLVLDETRPLGTETDGDSNPAGLGTVTANFANNFVGPVDYGADGAGTTTYSLFLSANGIGSGLFALDPTDTETVVDGFGKGAEIQLTINPAGTLITGAVGGTTYFTISIDPATGEVTFTQLANIWHADTANDDDTSTLTTAAASNVQVVQRVTDSDGDFDTASVNVGQGVFHIEDDGPEFTAVQAVLNIVNDADPAGTGNLDFDLGTDGPSANNDVISVSNFAVKVNGIALDPSDFSLTPGAETATTASYTFSFSYDTGSGGTATANGTLVFDKVNGSYTVDLDGPIEGFSILQTATGTLFQGYQFGTSIPDGSQPEISVTQIQGTPGNPQPDDLFVQFTSVAEPSSGTGDNNLELTSWVPGADNPNPVNGGGDTSFNAGDLFNQTDSWVSTSNTANGVAGDTIQGGEVLDFNLVQGANPTGVLADPSTYGQASSMFLKFDGIGSGEDMIVVLKLYDTATDTYTTKAIMIQNSDIQKGPGAGPGVYSGITLDNNDGLVIIEPNDYQEGNTNLVIVGAQIAGSDEGVSGTAINLNGAIGDAGASTGTQAFSTDTNDGPFKISSIGFVAEQTTDQNATLDFDVTIRDADGDTETQHLTVNIGDTPPAPMEPLSTKSGSSVAANDDYSSLLASDTVSKAYANSFGNVGTTGITSAMVAASGLAAMSMTSLNSFDQKSAGSLVQDSYQLSSAKTVVHDTLDQGIASISLGSEHGGSAFNAVNLSSSGFSFGDRGFDGGSLDAMSFGGSEPAYVPNFASGEPMVANVPAFAANVPTVSMASAEMLRAAALDGDARQGGAIEQVLADALGEQAPTIDALLANLPGGIGELAAIANLASPGGAGVPAWDMGMQGGFAPMHDMVMKVAAVALHQDAVQPA